LRKSGRPSGRPYEHHCRIAAIARPAIEMKLIALDAEGDGVAAAEAERRDSSL
jgi:hypothetical protein